MSSQEQFLNAVVTVQQVWGQERWLVWQLFPTDEETVSFGKKGFSYQREASESNKISGSRNKDGDFSFTSLAFSQDLFFFPSSQGIQDTQTPFISF